MKENEGERRGMKEKEGEGKEKERRRKGERRRKKERRKRGKKSTLRHEPNRDGAVSTSNPHCFVCEGNACDGCRVFLF
jgi:hypothetical protein